MFGVLYTVKVQIFFHPIIKPNSYSAVKLISSGNVKDLVIDACCPRSLMRDFSLYGYSGELNTSVPKNWSTLILEKPYHWSISQN